MIFHNSMNGYVQTILSLNVVKTKLMIFSKIPYIEDISIYVGKTKIELVDTMKLLGFTKDHLLTGYEHVSALYQKLLKIVYLIGKLKDYVPTGLLRNLYYAHFQSKQVYAIGVWGGLISKRDTERLYKLQKRVVRIITHSSYNCHTAPILKKLNIATLNDEVKLDNLRLMHRYHNETLPVSLRNLFMTGWAHYNMRSKNVLVPKHKDKKFNNCFLVKSLLHWSQLSPTCKKQSNTRYFIKHLKREFISKY